MIIQSNYVQLDPRKTQRWSVLMIDKNESRTSNFHICFCYVPFSLRLLRHGYRKGTRPKAKSHSHSFNSVIQSPMPLHLSNLRNELWLDHGTHAPYPIHFWPSNFAASAFLFLNFDSWKNDHYYYFNLLNST